MKQIILQLKEFITSNKQSTTLRLRIQKLEEDLIMYDHSWYSSWNRMRHDADSVKGPKEKTEDELIDTIHELFNVRQNILRKRMIILTIVIAIVGLSLAIKPF